MIVIGVDPGSINCGYGVIFFDGNSFKVLDFGIIKAKIDTKDFNDRLVKIFKELQEIIINYKAKYFVIEKTFYYKNAQSLIKLSHARAAAIIAGANLGLEIIEYSPNEVKQSVTGRGKASKEQVSYMVKTILGLTDIDALYDASDALSMAICHCLKYKYSLIDINKNQIQTKIKSKVNRGNNWENYIKDNPDKVKI
ncbi:MAG: crossover junction endodeoxyribonuclease RuvC [Candidatus Kapaibacteriota bacterium]